MEHHAMKVYWGMEVELHTLVTLTLDSGEWSASHPGHFTPREKSSWYPLYRKQVVRKKIPSPYWDLNPQSSSS
jgi:hypothetical protein